MPNKEKSDTTGGGKPVTGIDLTSDLATLQSLGFNQMNHFGTAWLEALSDMGSEVVNFVADRIKEDVKTQHEILHCEDLAELQEIQGRFVQKAIDQYTSETGKLVEMSHNFLQSQESKTND